MENLSGNEAIKLTQHSHGAGCGCKISPAVLEKILVSVKQDFSDSRWLIGPETKDDAAVYDLGNGEALISTTDFFTPILDDPFDFGRVAAANALSDVYAMGGKPFMAIAVLGWPVGKLPEAAAAQVLAGGRSVCDCAGVWLAGGHSIDSPEPFFGLAVSGKAPIPNLKRNNSAQAGDLLFLTKPIGTGLASTALKRGQAQPADLQPTMDNLLSINTLGEKLGCLPFVTALTDLTGFGLLGHTLEMCDSGRLGLNLFWDKVPVLPHTDRWIAAMMVPDASWRNWNAYSGFLTAAPTSQQMLLLADPQTNGGLLIAVAPDSVQEFLQTLGELLPSFAHQPIGRFDDSGKISLL